MSSATSPGSRFPDVTAHGRRVIACVDRSSFSEGLVECAISLAGTFQSTLTLVHVMQPRHEEHSSPRTTDALAWEISRHEAGAYLERLQTSATRVLGQPVEIRLEQGRPAERVLALAHESGAGLIVLGSHGESGAAAWNLGSTAQQVLAVARVSVFVAHTSPVAPSFVSPKAILVPLDGSLRSESVLPTAARIANAHGAELLLVHVVQEPVQTSVLRVSEDLELVRALAARLESQAKRYLERLRGQLVHEVARVRTLVVRHANQRQGLFEISKREHPDLIVISAHGATCDPAWSFGSVTTHLLMHSKAHLLVLQDLSESELDRAQNGLEEPAPPALRASHAPESV